MSPSVRSAPPAPGATCTAPGCLNNQHWAKANVAHLGYCPGHLRIHYHRHPEDRPAWPVSADERFQWRIDKNGPSEADRPAESLAEGDCWQWLNAEGEATGSTDFSYYGMTASAPVIAWELHTGLVMPRREVPGFKWHLHHHCWTPRCVRPSHLVAVPQWVNMLFPDPRGHGPRKLAALRAAKAAR